MNEGIVPLTGSFQDYGNLIYRTMKELPGQVVFKFQDSTSSHIRCNCYELLKAVFPDYDIVPEYSRDKSSTRAIITEIIIINA
jgi:hypothetical protein